MLIVIRPPGPDNLPGPGRRKNTAAGWSTQQAIRAGASRPAISAREYNEPIRVGLLTDDS
jgi:hypothetical protein